MMIQNTERNDFETNRFFPQGQAPFGLSVSKKNLLMQRLFTDGEALLAIASFPRDPKPSDTWL
jgi:hypothetical protein